MGEFLAKESIIYRGDNAELMAVPVDLETIPKNEDGTFKKIKVMPMTKGQMNILFSGVKNEDTTKEQDTEIITTYCINPKLTKEDLINTPQMYIQAIVFAILGLSTGIPQNSIQSKTRDKILEKIDENAEKN